MWLVQSWTLPFVRALLHACRFCTRWYSVASPMLDGARSDSTVRSQVRRGRPALRFQSLGRGATLALRANGCAVCIISPNSVALGLYYVKVVEDTLIHSQSEM